MKPLRVPPVLLGVRRGRGSRPLTARAFDIPGEGPNVAFTYRYRDADNYKVSATCVFEGSPTRWDDFQRLRQRLDGGIYFIPEQVGLDGLQASFDALHPDLDPDLDSDLDELDSDAEDHPWHEVEEGMVRRTILPPDQPLTWSEFLKVFLDVTSWDPSLSAYNTGL